MSTALQNALEKRWENKEQVAHYLSILYTHPENEWFVPVNSDGSFDVCTELASLNLICICREPIKNQSPYPGIKTSFKYSKDLNN